MNLKNWILLITRVQTRFNLETIGKYYTRQFIYTYKRSFIVIHNPKEYMCNKFDDVGPAIKG
jgi:hypothetical protein